MVKEPPSAASAAAAAGGSGGRTGSSEGVGGQLSSCLCMSGSKVLEGFGRMLVLAVGPNSQQVRRACGGLGNTLFLGALCRSAGHAGAFVHVGEAVASWHVCCGLHSRQYSSMCPGA